MPFLYWEPPVSKIQDPPVHYQPQSVCDIGIVQFRCFWRSLLAIMTHFSQKIVHVKINLSCSNVLTCMAAQAVVGSVDWAFLRLKSQGVGRWAPATMRFIVFASNFPSFIGYAVSSLPFVDVRANCKNYTIMSNVGLIPWPNWPLHVRAPIMQVTSAMIAVFSAVVGHCNMLCET